MAGCGHSSWKSSSSSHQQFLQSALKQLPQPECSESILPSEGGIYDMVSFLLPLGSAILTQGQKPSVTAA